MKFLKWAGILLVALVVLGLFLGGNKDDKAKTSSQQNTSASEVAANKADDSANTQAEKPIEVSAKKLFSDYQANEPAADDVYKGKLIKLSGKVDSINKDAFDNTVINLKTGNEFTSVHATMADKQDPKAKTVKKGQAITMLCVGGTMIVGSPMLNDCRIP